MAGEGRGLSAVSAEEQSTLCSLTVKGKGRYCPVLAHPLKSALENASVYYLPCRHYRSQACPNLPYNNISFNRQQPHINID